ncbi:MAG: HAD-IA family hydrolase [Pirellulaceae bacterium]|nr:HAD-IA family hydrolase [Pirellulaceae bacterium]
MIRVVLFDAVGTLFYPVPGVAEVYRAAGRRFGSNRTEAEIRQRFERALERQAVVPTSAVGVPTSAEGERARWRRIVAEVLDDATDAEAAFEALWEHFARPAHWRLFDDVEPAWARLRRQGLAAAIASNFDDRLEALCRGLPPLPDAVAVFHSAGIGYAKPDPRFYDEVARRLALSPEQLALVGDHLQHDYHAARVAGWHAVWLDRRATREPLADPDQPPPIRAASLVEAVELLLGC